MKIYIFIQEGLPLELSERLSNVIKEGYGYEISVGRLKNFNFDFAYNSERKQYFSPSILQKLQLMIPPDCLRLLLIVDIDLYDEGLNFIFGEAMGKVSIVSGYRFKPCIWMNRENEKQIWFDRIVKTCMHELAHTFGLSHCNNPKCVMYFSNWVGDTDKKSHRCCDRCREKLVENLSIY